MVVPPSAAFLIHLVQDVNILRPLIFMAARDFGFDTLLLVSTKFSARDTFGIWGAELEEIAGQTGARLQYFGNDWEAHRHLNRRGLLFSSSESHLHNHETTHNIFRHAPPAYLKVTLQHGFECIGFRHSRDHDRAHGPTASFGADIVCAWSDSQLTSLAPSQRGKLLVTGPTAVLQLPLGPVERERGARGLVCENLHSVRFKAAARIETSFVAAFEKFAQHMAARKTRIALRPHAGGQFFIKNRVPLPANVTMENAPLYRIDLRKFVYGISAPSSVLIDMVLADIPTAVWIDENGEIDASSYGGLPAVSTARDWIDFAQTAVENREALIARQRQFLERQRMPLDPAEVFSRFAQLFTVAERMEICTPAAPLRSGTEVNEKKA